MSESSATMTVETPGTGDDTESADTTAADLPRRSIRRPGRQAGVAALAAFARACASCACLLGWQWNEAQGVDAAARDALAAAQQYAVVLTSVNSGELDGNFAAVLEGATGEFKDMYAQSSEQLRQLLVDNNARAEGTVVESGIKSASKSRVEVLLFIDQSVTNALVQEPRLDRSRVVMTMELVDGRWLASEVALP
jgi:Mce-associated membrane protein